MSGSEHPASLGTLCPCCSWDEALHVFVLALRHPKSPKSSPAAWELPWTTLEVLCLFWAICSQPCYCLYLRFSTFCLHSHPFLMFASSWWCRKQPTLQTAAVIHWHHTAGVVPAASRGQPAPVTQEVFGQMTRCTSPAWALQCPEAPCTLEMTYPYVPSLTRFHLCFLGMQPLCP